jgi:hypothetical protein
MRAFVLEKVSAGLSKCSPAKASRALLDAFTATLMIPEREEDVLARQRRNDPSDEDAMRAARANIETKNHLQTTVLTQLLAKDEARVQSLLPQAEPGVRNILLNRMISKAVEERRLNRALTLLKQSPQQQFPYGAATSLMLELTSSQEVEKQEIFQMAMAADHESHKLNIGGDDFAGMIVRFWKHLPPAVALSAISQVLDEAKSNEEQMSIGSGAKSANFSSEYEYRVFELLPILRELDDEEAERLSLESSDVQEQLKQFPNGIQSLNPAIRDTPTEKGESSSIRVMLGPSITPMLHESGLSDDYEHRVSEVVQLAEKDPKQAIAAANTLPDAEGNLAPRAQAMLRIAQAVAKTSPSAARDALGNMSESLKNVKPTERENYRDFCAEGIEIAMKIDEVDLAKKLLKQGISQAEGLEAIDNDADDPNLVLKAWWPSSAVLSRLVVAAMSISVQTALDSVAEISDPELRLLCQVRLANHQLNIPLGESRTMVWTSKSAWAVNRMETVN